jgi:two-component system, LuxR family, response regulator FixJ
LTCVNALFVPVLHSDVHAAKAAPTMDKRMMKQARSAPARSVVLVIDDDLAVRNSLKFALEVEGFSVQVYPTGTALLEEDDIPKSGCLVADYHLPGMNGLELLQLLRERNVKLPAILITSHPTLAIRSRARSAGVHLIEKPLLNDTLFQCIRSALGEEPQHQ